MKQLPFFQKGVQSVKFSSKDGRFLVGLGVQSEGSFCIYELFDRNHNEMMRVCKKYYWTDDRPWNKIVVNPHVPEALEFVLIGA